MRSSLFTAPLATLALSQLLGCSASTEPQGNGGPPDDRGVEVSRWPAVLNLTWSTDGSELYFLEGYARIRAAKATALNQRTLYESSISLGTLRTAGNKLYVSTAMPGTPTRFRILRIDPSNSNVETVLTYDGGPGSWLFAISADERFVAFGDSLFDLVSATKVALPRGLPWSFSPDGSLLLYELAQAGGGPTSFILIPTNGAASQPLGSASDIPGRTEFAVGAHHWNGNDPRFLRVTTTSDFKLVKAFVFDIRTGTNREIGSVSSDGASHGDFAAISADGKRAVVSIWSSEWDQLHAIDTETLAEAVIATVNSDIDSWVEGLVLSPDGSRAAWVVTEGSLATGTPPWTTKVYVVTP